MVICMMPLCNHASAGMNDGRPQFNALHEVLLRYRCIQMLKISALPKRQISRGEYQPHRRYVL